MGAAMIGLLANQVMSSQQGSGGAPGQKEQPEGAQLQGMLNQTNQGLAQQNQQGQGGFGGMLQGVMGQGSGTQMGSAQGSQAGGIDLNSLIQSIMANQRR